MLRLGLSTLVFVIGLSSVTFAATIHVPADHLTIQAAIDAADPLDTIIVEAAVYNENIFIWQPLILLGNDNPTIDGGAIMATVTFVGTEGPETRFEGFTVQNGSDIYGGGIAGNGTEATIFDCIITANEADCGGGIFGCDGLIDDCQITLNTATYGGGLYRCDGTIIGCVIDENTADERGGGLYDCQASISFTAITNNSIPLLQGFGGGLNSCHGSITDCEISGNSATYHGGGLYDCDGTIARCTINDNTAGQYGGGLQYCGGSILYCYIQGNTAAYGGGLRGCNGGLIENCVISGNTSGGTGGGLDNCTSTVNNCTFVGNSGSNGGGLAYCVGITNSIVWFNKPLGPSFEQIYSCGTVSYCDVQDGDACTGCIITHPLFVDSGSWDGDTWIEGDYHLMEISPCVDAGDPAFTSEGTDMDGDPRVLNGRVDMGADEFDPSSGGELPDFDGDGIPDVNDPDIDDDGVPNATDVCDYTPLGATVQSNGTLRADCDGDCDVDLADFTIMGIEFTGPNSPE